MPRPVHFEILCDDPERAARFYADALDWETNTWGGGEQTYWLVTTGKDGPGIDGGLMGRHFDQKVINTIQVESLDETLAKVAAAGGEKVHGPNEIPNIGTVAYCTDTEGNMFGLLQPAGS